MARPGPRSEEKQEPGPSFGRDGVPLPGLEEQERSRLRLEALAGGFDIDRALDDEDERVLPDLVVAELLARVEPDQDGSSLVVGVENDGRPAAFGRLDLVQAPAAHGSIVPASLHSVAS